MTNRERLRRFVDQELLVKWGLEQVATWFWLKVTNNGQLVSPLVRPLHFSQALEGPYCAECEKQPFSDSQQLRLRGLLELQIIGSELLQLVFEVHAGLTMQVQYYCCQ